MQPATSFRLAAYGLAVVDHRILLVKVVHRDGSVSWTLPGGGVERLEDPFDAVVREFQEETGLDAIVEQLLGVDSRVIGAHESWRGVAHQNVGVYYRVRVAGGVPRQEPNGDTLEPTWTNLSEVAQLERSSLVDVGLRLLADQPATGHVPPVTIGGRIRH